MPCGIAQPESRQRLHAGRCQLRQHWNSVHYARLPFLTRLDEDTSQNLHLLTGDNVQLVSVHVDVTSFTVAGRDRKPML